MLIVTCLSTKKHEQRRRSVLAFHLLKCLLQRDMRAASLESHQFALICPHWVPAARTLWQVWLLQFSTWWRASLSVQTQATNILPAVQVWPPTKSVELLLWGKRLSSCKQIKLHLESRKHKYGLKQIRGHASNLLNRRQFTQLNFEVLFFYVQVTNLRALWMNQSC